MNGRDVAAGDTITFAPGGKPIHVASIEPAQYRQPALDMTYRIFLDVAGTGYALFDDQTVGTVPARSVVERA